MSAPDTTRTQAAPAATTDEQRRAATKAVVAASIGNALEWFDIIVYASFAVVISKLFFPETTGVTALLYTFGAFGVSYLVRPLGAMVLGSYGDRAGRKAALTMTIGIMMVGTAIMAFAPTAATIGSAAGLLILLSRLLQGFSAGGEFGTATAFLIEHAPDRKAFYASWQVATQGASMFLASLFGYGLNTWLTTEQLESWGWRVPFIFGMLIGPVGLYIRSRMSETPEFAETETVKSPLWSTIGHNTSRVLTGAACVGLATISVYLILYMPTFAVKSLELPAYAGYLGGIISGLVTLCGVPYVGALADRVGPVVIMRAASIAAVVLAWPMFALLVANPTVWGLTVVEVVLGVIMALYFGPLPALLSELFPTAIRTTGLSVSYNLGVTLFGGFAPLVLTWLIDKTGSLLSPSVYYIAIALLSLGGLFVARSRFVTR
ncbi:MFS transporter [Knoellia sp. 3-2P3]|uniref:MFS transporter n=1 Tax=unclassified Knoellia TaxID=2618719 RepID=UPI0023DB66F7|nr:MFS transporter [Knoellia sp. 3-2P3]MDF2091144.1 MFS transporter [Knoellia sp. 3-2P3]